MKFSGMRQVSLGDSSRIMHSTAQRCLAEATQRFLFSLKPAGALSSRGRAPQMPQKPEILLQSMPSVPIPLHLGVVLFCPLNEKATSFHISSNTLCALGHWQGWGGEEVTQHLLTVTPSPVWTVPGSRARSSGLVFQLPNCQAVRERGQFPLPSARRVLT